ncbi:hypothetical protein CTN06_12145 [Pectobacterium zantedeschiae]|uniref:Uncharacterized protein n=1 Tax=Pectobacterium zantedeschiae TaxID=2034769 RepID=A0A9X8P6A5_9GAMM|nr:hypothetical protein CTN06_20300 [Pectobacterium zantedeschiae]RYC42104.1 hypothetical protein CTN06_12145 [Pectobacterium zantedeschiae]RYC45341.1 hypothetical protein CLR69_10265 [Pectobacterium zantedeschiae]
MTCHPWPPPLRTVASATLKISPGNFLPTEDYLHDQNGEHGLKSHQTAKRSAHIALKSYSIIIIASIVRFLLPII